MTLDLQAVAEAMGARGKARPVKVTGWSVDTRTQSAGDVYFALRGPNFDGHDFGPAALERGAETPVYLAADEAVAGVTGRYFVDKRATPSAKATYDEALQERLWTMSEQAAQAKR